MFLLYPLLIASLYAFYKKFPNRCGRGGPLNPIDDMPARIMPHVMTCISYDDETGLEVPKAPTPRPEPNRKSWKQSKTALIQELPFRRKRVLDETMGKDCAHYPDKDEDYTDLLKNIEKYEMLKILQNPYYSLLDKMDMWRRFRDDGEQYTLNIFSGGLMKDWDKDNEEF